MEDFSKRVKSFLEDVINGPYKKTFWLLPTVERFMLWYALPQAWALKTFGTSTWTTQALHF